MIKKALLVGAVAFLFASCGNQGGKDEAVAVAFADFEKTAVDMVDKTISIEGTVVHVCSHGGKRMFISDEEGEKRIKIEVSDETTAFTPDLEGSIVKVTGKVVEFRIDEPYLAEWEAELKAEIEETGDTTVKHEEDPGFDVEHIHNDSKYEDLERIANYRSEIAENGKGYIAFYSLSYVSHEVLEAAAPKMDEATEEHDHDHSHGEEAATAEQTEDGGLTKTDGDRTKGTIQDAGAKKLDEKAESMNKALSTDDRTKSTIEDAKVNVEEAKADINKATAPATKDVRTIKKADGTK